MIKKLLLILVVFLTACSSSDELTVETELWYCAKDNYDNRITGDFYFFKDGEYDPKSFTYVKGLLGGWDSGELTTKKGEKVKSFFLDVSFKTETGYSEKELEPGYYIVVALVKNYAYEDLWRVERVPITKNKFTIWEAIFNKTEEGYVE